MNDNIWTTYSDVLVEAYSQKVGTVRNEMIIRALQAHMSQEPKRIVDLGGGNGQLAIMLAKMEHDVTIVDIDSKMLAIAERDLLKESIKVRNRVKLVLGRGSNACNLVGNNFDIACCHGVIKFENDPIPILSSLVNLVKKRGIISVLSLNTDSIAMRSGLQQKWREARLSIEQNRQMGNQYLPIREYSRKEVSHILTANKAKIKKWYGVGIFTDHITKEILVNDPEDVYSLEWLAGTKDPYRQIARCFHIIAEKLSVE